MTRVNRRVLIMVAAAMVLAAAVFSFGMMRVALAAPGFALSCSPTSAGPGQTTVVCTAPGAYSYKGSEEKYCGQIFVGFWEEGFSEFAAHWIYSNVAHTVISWDIEDGSEERNILSNSLLGCSASSDPDPYAAGIWASQLCEPYDGFSPDGWSTLDADTIPPYTKLWVAPGPAGPWSPTEFMQPPYVMSMAHVDGLTAWMGLTDYHDLWFKPGQTGIAANYGSMIADREMMMDDLCGN